MMAASAPGEGSEHKLMTFAKTFDTNDIRRRIVQELASVFDKGTPVPTPEDLQKMFDALDNQENVEISDVHLKKMLRYVDDQKEFARNFAPLFYTEGSEHDVSKVIIYLTAASPQGPCAGAAGTTASSGRSSRRFSAPSAPPPPCPCACAAARAS